MELIKNLWSGWGMQYKAYAVIAVLTLIMILFLSLRSCVSETINKPDIPEHENEDIKFNTRNEYDSILDQLQDYIGTINAGSGEQVRPGANQNHR